MPDSVPDELLWVCHLVYWVPFLVRGQLDRRRGTRAAGATVHAAPYARSLVAAHTVVTVWTHVGIGLGVTPGTDSPAVRDGMGLVLFVLACSLAWSCLWVFRSWRLRAELSSTHTLCTDGPFRWLRHPIYASLSVLGVATVVWWPNVWTVLGLVGNVVVGELRGRAEEALLVRAFGERYQDYMARTARWIPGIY